MTRIGDVGICNPGAAEIASAPEVEPAVQEQSGTAPTADQAAETPDSGRGKRMERDLEAAYFRAELSNVPQGHAAGVAYGKTQSNTTSGGAATQATAVAPSKIVGKVLGNNSAGNQVKVTRELGSANGYDNRLQAVAAARMAGAEPAAVIQSDGKWYAVETTAPADSVGSNVSLLPPFAQVDQLSKDVTAIKQKLTEEDKTLSAGKKDELTAKLMEDQKKLASLLFGVDESQIQFNRSARDDSPDKINIVPKDPHRPGDPLGSEHYDGDKSFAPGLKPTFDINLEELEKPKEAAGVLFHEVSHLQDDQLAQKWVSKYEEKHTFVEGASGRPAFKAWMNEQVKQNNISKADAEVVVDKAENDTATSEARAYLRTAVTAIQSGNPELAAQQLKTYASGIKAGKIASPATGSEVEKALTKELQDAYRQMPANMQQQLKNAFAAAHTANAEAWISHVKFGK